MTDAEVVAKVRELAELLADDIRHARTRESHVLATLRANQALALANGMTQTTDDEE